MTTKTITQDHVDQFKSEIETLTAEIAAIDEQAVDPAVLAELGDAGAKEQLQEFQADAEAKRARIAELERATQSAERMMKRQAEEAAERQRAAAAEEASKLAKQQGVLAKKFDKLLADLGATYAEFAALNAPRHSAVTRAGNNPVRYDNELVRAIWGIAPQIGDQLQIDIVFRPHGQPLAEQSRIRGS